MMVKGTAKGEEEGIRKKAQKTKSKLCSKCYKLAFKSKYINI